MGLQPYSDCMDELKYHLVTCAWCVSYISWTCSFDIIDANTAVRAGIVFG